MAMLNVEIPDELHHRLKVYAAQHKKTMKQVVTEAMNAYNDETPDAPTDGKPE